MRLEQNANPKAVALCKKLVKRLLLREKIARERGVMLKMRWWLAFAGPQTVDEGRAAQVLSGVVFAQTLLLLSLGLDIFCDSRKRGSGSAARRGPFNWPHLGMTAT